MRFLLPPYFPTIPLKFNFSLKTMSLKLFVISSKYEPKMNQKMILREAFLISNHILEIGWNFFIISPGNSIVWCEWLVIWCRAGRILRSGGAILLGVEAIFRDGLGICHDGYAIWYVLRRYDGIISSYRQMPAAYCETVWGYYGASEQY